MVYLTWSSINRTSGTDSDFISYSDQNLPRYKEIRLHQFVMINGLYNVTDTNSGFYFTVADDADGTNAVDYDFTLTNGYYDVNTIRAALKTGIENLISPLTVTITNLSSTGKFSFTLSGGKYLRVNATSGGASSAPGLLNLLLGFSRSSDSDFDTVLIPGREYNMNRYANLYLLCDLVRNRGWLSATNDLSPQIGSIPIGSVGFQQQLVYEPAGNQEFIRIQDADINTVHFWLVDDQGNKVDLNGLYMTVVLEAR